MNNIEKNMPRQHQQEKKKMYFLKKRNVGMKIISQEKNKDQKKGEKQNPESPVGQKGKEAEEETVRDGIGVEGRDPPERGRTSHQKQ